MATGPSSSGHCRGILPGRRVEADGPDAGPASSRIADGTPATCTMGTTSTAPAAAFTAAAVRGAERWRPMMTPFTPAHTALRKMEPKLPGSVTPSRTNQNGGTDGSTVARSASRGTPATGSAQATTPWGAEVWAAASRASDLLIWTGTPGRTGQFHGLAQRLGRCLAFHHPEPVNPTTPGRQELTDSVVAFDLLPPSPGARLRLWSANGHLCSRRATARQAIPSARPRARPAPRPASPLPKQGRQQWQRAGVPSPLCGRRAEAPRR